MDNYRKILKTVMNYIGISVPEEQEQEQGRQFVDPGWNEDPKSKLSGLMAGTSSSKPRKSENKKVIIGPGQAKSKPQEKVEPPKPA